MLTSRYYLLLLFKLYYYFFDSNTFFVKILFRVVNNKHMYDATEIFRTLGQHKKECFAKLGFYLVCFFYYLYRYETSIKRIYYMRTLWILTRSFFYVKISLF